MSLRIAEQLDGFALHQLNAASSSPQLALKTVHLNEAAIYAMLAERVRDSMAGVVRDGLLQQVPSRRL